MGMQSDTADRTHRWRQAALLAVIRAIVQAARLIWPPLTIHIARDLGLSLSQQGTLLSAFPLGYALTQVAGGSLADRLGGAPMQMVSLLGFAFAMLTAPTLADVSGLPGLWATYFVSGLFAGPQQPSYSAMVSCWFLQEELGTVTTVADMGTIGGELIAASAAPMAASVLGWRATFVTFGFVILSFCPVWGLLAQSRPPVSKLDEASSPTQLAVATAAPAAEAGSRPLPPLRALLLMPVWSVVLQHMCFNVSKYFYSFWMASYYAGQLAIEPSESGRYLGAVQLLGIFCPPLWARAERYFIRNHGASLLLSRRTFAMISFSGNAVCACLLGLLHSSGRSSAWTVCLALAANVFFIGGHGLGYKANYNDLTVHYSGLLMGFGNTLATCVTFAVPIVTGRVMESAGAGSWATMFLCNSLICAAGVAVALFGTSVERLDDRVEQMLIERRDVWRPEEALGGKLE